MSSDEEPFDPFYQNYHRRLDGLPVLKLPQQQNSVKREDNVFNDVEMETAMDWETANVPGSQTQTKASSSHNGDDDDRDTVVYRDPDDRMPSPPVQRPKPQDRAPILQNIKFSESRYRTPLRNLNTRGRVVHSSTRGRGRNFGPSRAAIPRSPRRNRNVYIPPHRPTLPRQTPLHEQPNAPRGRSPHRAIPIPDAPEIPELYQERPFQQPRPGRPLFRPPEFIRLTDDSHLIPERGDVKWSNRKYEKTSSRFNRKSKGVAFFETFKRNFAPHRLLQLEDEEDNIAGEENSSEERNVRYEGDGSDDFIPDADDGVAVDTDVEEVIVMSPAPHHQPKQLYRAIKQVVEISDDSDPDSVEDSDVESSDAPSVGEYLPEPIIAAPFPNATPRPPEAIIEALRPTFPSSSSPKLPFLRRNLKQSFYHTFVHHLAQQKRSMPKIPAYHQPPSIQWEYQVTPDAETWQVVQEAWFCQLCDSFPPFTLGSALMYHLKRDHPAIVARREKLGFGKWRITVNLFGSASSGLSSASNQEHSSRTRESSSQPPKSELGTESTELDDGDQTDDPVEQIAVAMMELDTGGEVKRYRVGGTRCYDLAMQEMAMPLKGLAAKTLEGRENDICFYGKFSDKEKSMSILFGRWISQHRLEFVRDPLKNATTFIDKHWEIIYRTAGQEGLIRWLLAMKFHRYFTQAQVAQLSKRYQRHLP